MVLELELEDIVLGDIVVGSGDINIVTQERQTGQRKVILEGFVEIETEVGKHDPQLLPAIAVLELPQQVA